MFYKTVSVVIACIVFAFSSSIVSAQNARSSSRAGERANINAQGAGSHHEGEIKKVTPSVRRRQIRQKARIAEGVKSGELTPEETKELMEGQREVRQMKKEARSDGKVTAEERIEIQKKLNKESREIYREKHDNK